MGIVNYTVAVDIWSVGCIMAELALLQPFFIGKNDGDQLFAILKILGSLS
jgi:glycogen synthase kinase 3 beta